MTRNGLTLLVCMAVGGAYAQGTDGGVTMSTDPAKAAAVESHARELQARQGNEPTSTHKGGKSATHAKSGTHAKSSTHSSSHSTHKSSTTKHDKSSKT